MSFIEWRDDFATGIESIDYEHQLLVSLINSAHERLGMNPPHASVLIFLDIAYNTFASHFEVEEDVMDKNFYDQREAHRSEHRLLLQELQAIRDQQSTDSGFDPDALRETLVNWFVQHFRTHDARLHAIHHH